MFIPLNAVEEKKNTPANYYALTNNREMIRTVNIMNSDLLFATGSYNRAPST